jgi:hypothetical protein
VNDVIYKYAKFHYEILRIAGYTKITNFGKIYRFKVYILRYRRLLFLCSPKYNVFERVFLCSVNVYFLYISFLEKYFLRAIGKRE